MEQKGFTLVELIGVLVVLSLLAIIISNLFTSMADKAKGGITKVQEKSIIQASEKWAVDNSEKFDDIKNYKTIGGLDVVFILDRSLSMSNKIGGWSGQARYEAMVDAFNASMAVLEGPTNRQAVYVFGSDVEQLLPLGTYTSSDGIYLTAGSNRIKPSPTLKVRFSAEGDYQGIDEKVKEGIVLSGWTNIQEGIYKGTYLLLETTPEEIEKRVPVVILLTDGLPNTSNKNMCGLELCKATCDEAFCKTPFQLLTESGFGSSLSGEPYAYTLLAGYEAKQNLKSHYVDSENVYFYTIGLGDLEDDDKNGVSKIKKILNPGVDESTAKYNYVTKSFINSGMSAEELKRIFVEISSEVVDVIKVVQVCVSVEELYDGGYLSTDDIKLADGKEASTYVIMSYNEATNQYNFSLAKTEEQKKECELLLAQ